MTGFQTSDRHQTGRSLSLSDAASPLRMNDFNFYARATLLTVACVKSSPRMQCDPGFIFLNYRLF
jgi:hypothetical protein